MGKAVIEEEKEGLRSTLIRASQERHILQR